MSNRYVELALYSVLIVFSYIFVRLVVKALNYLVVTLKDLIIVELTIK